MSYTLRYSRLFSLPGFENEKFELEMEFADETPKWLALRQLKKEIMEMREKEEVAKKMGVEMPF